MIPRLPPRELAVSPAASPDGRWLAFLRARDDAPDSAGLWLYDLSADTLRLLTARGGGMSWSPDGTKLVVSSEGRLFIVDVRSGALSAVPGDSRTAGREYFPAWSPDGSSLAYDVRADGIYVRPAAGGAGRRVTTGLTAAWLPDGSGLAYDGSSTPQETIEPQQVRVVDLATGRWRPIATPSVVPDYVNRGGACVGLVEYARPAVSPDGQWVAFVAWDRDVWLVALDGSGLQALTYGGLPEDLSYESGYCNVFGGNDPAWAADGRSVFFVRASERLAREPGRQSAPLVIWRLSLVDRVSVELPLFSIPTDRRSRGGAHRQ